MAALLGDGAEAVINRAIADAKKGKPVALRLIMERLVPKLKAGAVLIDVPRVDNAEGLIQACAGVIASAAAGDLTLGEAKEFMAILELQRKAIETHDLAVRLERLESIQLLQPSGSGRAIPARKRIS